VLPLGVNPFYITPSPTPPTPPTSYDYTWVYIVSGCVFLLIVIVVIAVCMRMKKEKSPYGLNEYQVNSYEGEEGHALNDTEIGQTQD